MKFRYGLHLGLIALALASVAWSSAVQAQTLVFHAASSGQQTLDEGEGGGNPFASAFREILAMSDVTLGRLPSLLKELTRSKSGDFQTPEVPTAIGSESWLLVPAQPGEKRVALVLVVSDYSSSGGLPTLSGAKLDADRIASALYNAGFEIEFALDVAPEKLRHKLAAFAPLSSAYDVAVTYVTGHGVEVGGQVFVLPGDYPIAKGNAALASRALPLREIAQASKARKINLVLYGGCRDNPFGKQ